MGINIVCDERVGLLTYMRADEPQPDCLGVMRMGRVKEADVEDS